MIEKVNPSHPDKIADRIAGAIVDLAYKKERNPRIAVEILIGHGICHVITESSVNIAAEDIEKAVHRIAGKGIALDYHAVKQDDHLAKNQEGKIRCGDNGIFKGVPLTEEQMLLSRIARRIYRMYPYDGKYILALHRMIICQSHAKSVDLQKMYTLADVSINIYAFLEAQRTGKAVELCCAIGDETVDGISYSEIVEEAREYIESLGGFEKFAEWGLY